MRHHLREMLGWKLIPVPGGIALGAAAATVYALLCTALYWLLTGKSDPLVPLVIRFSLSGAAAGAIVGVCLTFDWATRGAPPATDGDEPGEGPLGGCPPDQSKRSRVATVTPAPALRTPRPEAVSGFRPEDKQLLARLAARGGLSGGAASMN